MSAGEPIKETRRCAYEAAVGSRYCWAVGELKLADERIESLRALLERAEKDLTILQKPVNFYQERIMNETMVADLLAAIRQVLK